MPIVYHQQVETMKEKKNFLILAIGLGTIGVIIGGITIWSMASDLLSP